MCAKTRIIKYEGEVGEPLRGTQKVNMASNDIVSVNTLLPRTGSKLPAITKTYVGIDFGTSTTVVSMAQYDKNQGVTIKAVPIEQKLDDGGITRSELVPSVIALYKSKILVGEGASYQKYLLQRDEYVWYSFKMQLGEGIRYFSSALKDAGNLSINSPQDATAVFFMYLKQQIEKYCHENGYGTDIEYAVSIPASFEANQRKDLVEALRRNNIMVGKQALIDEPNAAFLSYVQESATSNDDEHKIVVQNDYNPKILVFDFGGGTCDISILEIGKGANGLYSKNLSISKFTQLGGDDIDRYISWNYLLPEIIKENGKTLEDFRLPDKKRIVNHLMKIAEQLKINVCKRISCMMDNFNLPAIINSEERLSVHIKTTIDTKKGELRADEFSLSFKEFTDVMSVFTNRRVYVTRKERQEDYNSIFNPIESALNKAHVDKDGELDYVLFIGGSSKNPYIQNALSEYFEESELLIPNNLQTHVSKGAAIHSLIINGFGKNIIQPITSEPIIVVTKSGNQRVLIPAGAQIPCEKITIDDLETNRDGQDVIELPICVGNSNKMLFNIKINLPASQIKKGERVTLTIEYTADKLLKTEAFCHGVKVAPEQLDPFANKELSSGERAIILAEREVDRSASANGGTPSKDALTKLIDAYYNAGNKYMAAETSEIKEDFYPGSVDFNDVGIMYSNSGNKAKAISAYERALSKQPGNATICVNMAMEYDGYDNQKFKEYAQKAYEMSPGDPVILINMSRAESDGEKAAMLKKQAYDIYLDKFKSNRMNPWDYSWFASLAGELGHYDIARKVRAAQPGSNNVRSLYNEENLANSSNKQLQNR